MTEPIPFADVERIYPTENDIAFSPYNGVNSSEVNFSKNLYWRNPHNCILSNIDGGGLPLSGAGFLPADGGGLNVSMNGGRAYISGRYMELNAGTNYVVACDADRDVYLFLQLNISGVVNTSPPANIVTVPVTHGSQPTIPVDSVLLALVVTGAGSIVSITDYRPSQINKPVNVNLSSILVTNRTPEKCIILAPPEDMYLCGFFNIWNASNNNTTDVSFDFTVTGPNGTEIESFSGITLVGSPSNEEKIFWFSIKIPIDLGRYKGGYVTLLIDNVVSSVGGYTVEVASTDSEVGSQIQDVSGTWALKEWKAIG